MASLEERVAGRIAREFHVARAVTETDRKLYRGELLVREEAEGLLGEGTFDAYLYAHTSAEGLWRRCGNVAISHMVEVGERAKNLDFGFLYVAVALLHDVVEDKSEVIRDSYKLTEDVRAKFGGEAARNVAAITNHYAILIEGIERLTIGTPAMGYSNDMLLNALDRLRTEAGNGVIAGFEKYFGGLRGIIENLDIGEVNKKIGKNDCTIFDELKSRAYGLYIADIFADAKKRYEEGEERYDAGVITKGIDDIDNLRTMGLDVPVMEKALGKIEVFLRHAEEFKDFLSSRGEENEGFLTVYGALKEQVVEQLVRRRLALEFYNDTRFVPIKMRIDEKIWNYADMFKVDVKNITERVVSQSSYSFVMLPK